MQPPIRTTRSNPNPGLIDHPSACCPSTVVTKEKAKKQQVMTLKAELCQCTAQVSELEREVRRAQAEVQPVRQGGRAKVVTKKTFPCPGGDTNVSQVP